MSKLLRWSVCGLAAALVLGVCANSYASLIPSYTPFTAGTTSAYGSGAADYESRQDAYSPNVPPGSNDLLTATVGEGGHHTGLFVNTIGLGELITPQTGSTYGALNNHGMTVNTLTMPLSGANNITVTLKITPGQLIDSATSLPAAPNDGANTDVWTPSGPAVYTNTFVNSPAGASLTYLDLLGANLADPVNNPAAPVLTLNQTYLVSLGVRRYRQSRQRRGLEPRK
jgi:hypothetical protein